MTLAIRSPKRGPSTEDDPYYTSYCTLYCAVLYTVLYHTMLAALCALGIELTELDAGILRDPKTLLQQARRTPSLNRLGFRLSSKLATRPLQE